MGQTISGFIIDKQFGNKEELENSFVCELQQTNQLKHNELTNGKCNIFFLNNSTLILLDHDQATEPYSIANAVSLSFLLSDTIDGYSLTYCKDMRLIRSYKSMASEKIEEIGEELPDEKTKDDYSLILQMIKDISGEDLFEAIDINSYKTFDIKISPSKVLLPKTDTSSDSKKVNIKRPEFEDIKIEKPLDIDRSDEFFRLLSNDNIDTVLQTLSELTKRDINTHTVTYILVLLRFHWDAEVRKEAKKLFGKFSMENLLDNFQFNWEDKHRNTQGNHEKKEYYEHSCLETIEYFLFAYIIRRKYFKNKPVKGMYNVYSMSTGNKDEIQNVFECYGENIRSVPEKIRELENIGVAKFHTTKNLMVEEAVEQLAYLPNLHNLFLWGNDIPELPSNVNKLYNLKRLELYKNSIVSFNQDIYLPNLNYLSIAYNNISELDLKQFPNIDTLTVGLDYKPNSIKFKNITKPFTVRFGNQIFEEIKP